MSTIRDVMTRHRGIIIFLFVVPFSFAFQKVQDVRTWFFRTFQSTARLHNEKVRIIASLVSEAHKAGRKMCTARAPWKTMSIRKATYKDQMARIPIDLRNILELDEERLTVTVEPMVTMGDITRYLIPKGYALAVQVEMDDLTVGGLCMGIGIETSSHRHGFLFETIEAYEIISPDGRLIRATREENSDLYFSLPMSHGTLGFLTSVELRIVRVGKYMKVTYLPCHTPASFRETMATLSAADGPMFLEGLVFNGQQGVVMCGEFADKADGPVNAVNRWYKPWFHTHAESFLTKGSATEYIPVRHYFHRHTPSVFFQLRDLIPFANRTWYRWLFGWLGAPKISLMKYSMTPELRRRAFLNRVAQDIIIPMNTMEEALEYAAVNYRIYPLWVCPVRLFNHGEMEGIIRNPERGGASEMYFDLGIYGISPRVAEGTWNSVEVSRALEKFTRDRGGFHMLYADIFMTRPEFEHMFSHDLYRRMREKYGASRVFPEVYDKVIPEKWLIDLDEFESEPEAVVIAGS